MAQLSTVRVLLADDFPLFRERVASLLEPAFEVVEKVGDGESLLEAATKLDPDLIITDRVSWPPLIVIRRHPLFRLPQRQAPAGSLLFLGRAESHLLGALALCSIEPSAEGEPSPAATHFIQVFPRWQGICPLSHVRVLRNTVTSLKMRFANLCRSIFTKVAPFGLG